VRLTRRGEIVFLIGLALLILGSVFTVHKVATSLWWTGEGYCFGSVEKCYNLEGEGKK
jgi:hypothetical protein